MEFGDILLGASITQQNGRRVARQEMDHAEDDDGHAEHDEDHQNQPFANVRAAAHSARSAPRRSQRLTEEPRVKSRKPPADHFMGEHSERSRKLPADHFTGEHSERSRKLPADHFMGEHSERSRIPPGYLSGYARNGAAKHVLSARQSYVFESIVRKSVDEKAMHVVAPRGRRSQIGHEHQRRVIEIDSLDFTVLRLARHRVLLDRKSV